MSSGMQCKGSSPPPLSHVPDTVSPRHNLAGVLKSKGDYDAAEAEFRAVLEGNRERRTITIHRGGVA